MHCDNIIAKVVPACFSNCCVITSSLHYILYFTATVNEDYLDVELNITFTSGQNASGDNQQCFSVVILNDDLLECNETFDILLTPLADDADVINITEPVFTVTIEEDPNDCMLIITTNVYLYNIIFHIVIK